MELHQCTEELDKAPIQCACVPVDRIFKNTLIYTMNAKLMFWLSSGTICKRKNRAGD